MLTNGQVREAKPRTIRYEITCDALPGFILRVLPTGKKVFFARYRGADGKDHRHRLGLVGPGYGVDEARREAMAILARREAPTSVGEPTPAAKMAAVAPTSGPKSPTLREFALRFEHEHIDMHQKPETASHFRSSLRRYIIPKFGDRPLDEITTLEIQQFVNKLKPTTRRGTEPRSGCPCTASRRPARDQAHLAGLEHAHRLPCDQQQALPV